MKNTFKLMVAASCMLATSTPSYAWLDRLDTKEKLAIGTAAVGAIHSMATADERKAEEEKQQADAKRKNEERKTAEANTANDKKKKLSRVDSLITGKFGFNIGEQMDESKCLKKDRAVGFCYVNTGNNKYFTEAMVNYNPETKTIFSVVGVKKSKLKYEYASNLAHSKNTKQAKLNYANACKNEYNYVVDALMQKGFKESDLSSFPLVAEIGTQATDFITGDDRKHTFLCASESTNVGKVNFGRGWETKTAYMLAYIDTKLEAQAQDALKRAKNEKRNSKAKAAASDF